MRINQFVARATGVSRRAADKMITDGIVRVNGQVATLGQTVTESDSVAVHDEPVKITSYRYLLLNKPPGYISSRRSQGDSPTIYDLLPDSLHSLKPVGRLDRDSRGLMLLTDNGDLSQLLTHPSNQKTKIYRVVLHKQLAKRDLSRANKGVELKDGISHMEVVPLKQDCSYRVRMQEGRNRQIRRTFSQLGYEVVDLQRTHLGKFTLKDISEGEYRETKQEYQEISST